MQKQPTNPVDQKAAITETVPARVGILGNPSDGYGGRTLAMAVPAFLATVTLQTSDRLEIEPTEGSGWESVADLVEDVDRHGYGDGRQLLVAAIRTFVDVTRATDQRLGKDRDGAGSTDATRAEDPLLALVNKSAVVDQKSTELDDVDPTAEFVDGAFRLRFHTTIPRQVGLAGSSALVIACLRCLGRFTDTELPDDVLATIALRVETEQLGITAGLQDRVIQTYGGLVSMDFSQMTTDPRFGVATGQYTKLDAEHLPPLFVSYRLSSAEESDVYHRELRRRYDSGDATVRETLRRLAALVVEGEAALRWRDSDKFAKLIAENMRLRRTLAPLTEQQLELVDAATFGGAHCTFTGSGGAIVGAYKDDGHFDQLASTLARLDAVTVKLN